MYQDYIEGLYKRLEEKADPKVKDWWEGYVKQRAPFIKVGKSLILH